MDKTYADLVYDIFDKINKVKLNSQIERNAAVLKKTEASYTKEILITSNVKDG